MKRKESEKDVASAFFFVLRFRHALAGGAREGISAACYFSGVIFSRQINEEIN